MRFCRTARIYHVMNKHRTFKNIKLFRIFGEIVNSLNENIQNDLLDRMLMTIVGDDGMSPKCVDCTVVDNLFCVTGGRR